MAIARKPGPQSWRILRVVVAALIGVAAGIVIFGIKFSEMPSYFSSDPVTCTNCHVMQPQYDAWSRGPHRNVATCDDCHLPHDNIVDRYLVQAQDGILHGYKFTTNDYPVNIVIRPSSLNVANAACLACHGTMTSTMFDSAKTGETITCTRCHAHVGHDN